MKAPIFALMIVLFGAGYASAQSAEKPPLTSDVAAVPGDAVAFIHVRVADLWKSDAFKDFRDVVLKAGAPALEGFDKRFLPAPSSIERLTAFVLQPSAPGRRPEAVLIIGTNREIEKETFLKHALPDGSEKKIGKGKATLDAKAGIGVYFIDDRTFAVSDIDGITGYLMHQSGPGYMTEAKNLTHTQKPIVIGFNPSLIPAGETAQVPTQFQPLLKASLLTLTVEVKSGTHLELQAIYPDAKSSQAAHEVVKLAAKMALVQMRDARKEMLAKVLGDGKISPIAQLPEAAGALFALGAIEQAEEFLNDPPVQRKENRLEVSIKMSSGANLTMGLSAVGVGLLLPAVQKVREAAGRAKSSNNLKQMGLAMHNYHDVNGTFPAAAICDKDKEGKPLLSWRVAILPYIEQNNLYQQFKLNEPWDSEHNKKLIDKMPNVYLNPAAKPEPGKTHYRAFVGGGAAFDLTKGVSFVNFADGTSNTLLFAESPEGVIWTKPEDFAYDPKKPLPKLGGLNPGGFLAAFADGSVRFIKSSVGEKTLRALITRAEGDIPGSDY